MTEPVNGSRTETVLLNGRQILVKPLVDTQMVHVMRHARILQRDDVAIPQKLESVERLLDILHRTVVKPEDLAFVLKSEEDGDIEIRDLMPIMTAFDKEEEPEKPKARRGRPPRQRT